VEAREHKDDEPGRGELGAEKTTERSSVQLPMSYMIGPVGDEAEANAVVEHKEERLSSAVILSMKKLLRSSVIRTTKTTSTLRFSFLQPTIKITAGDFEADCA